MFEESREFIVGIGNFDADVPPGEGRRTVQQAVFCPVDRVVADRLGTGVVFPDWRTSGIFAWFDADREIGTGRSRYRRT